MPHHSMEARFQICKLNRHHHRHYQFTRLCPPAQGTAFNFQEHYTLRPGVYGWSAKFQTETQAYNIEFQNLGKIAAPDYYDTVAQVLDAAV